MGTQFLGYFLILSQYLLLAKKASNFKKKSKFEKFKFECIMRKSFIHSNLDFLGVNIEIGWGNTKETAYTFDN